MPNGSIDTVFGGAPDPAQPAYDPLPRRSAAIVIVAGCIGLYSLPAAILIFASIAAIVATPFAGWAILAFFAWTSGLCGILDYTPIDLGVFNVYVSDAILVIYFWTLLHMIAVRQRQNDVLAAQRERRLVALWAIWSVLGILFVINGFYIHNMAFDRAFGDFRRSTVYAMAFFVPLLFPFNEKQLRLAEWSIYAGGLIVIAIGAYRLATGTAARVDENYETGHLAIRLMGIAECMTLACLLALLTLQWRTAKSIALRTSAFLLMAPCAVLLLLSGFRLAMAFVIVVPLLTLVLIAWVRRENLARLAWIFAKLSIVAIPVAAVVAIVFSDQFDKMLLDLHLRLINVEGGFRRWAYEAAIGRFLDSPIFGQGFGYYLVVPTRNQAGLFDYVEMNNPHNMFLGVLYQTGIVGTVPFVLFHGFFFVYAVRWLRQVDPKYRRTYIALFVTYLCYLAYMSLQPYVSSQFILLYMAMGFIVRLARPSPEATQPDRRNAT
jgi:O-antigen ligase